MITKNRLSVLAMLLITVLSVAYFVAVGLRVPIGDSNRTARLVVEDTNGIVEGSKVLVRGIETGRVTGVRNVADGVELTWQYPESESIPGSSTFRVDTLSALGEAYIAVFPTDDHGPYLADGVRVQSDRIVPTTSFRTLSSRLTGLLTQVDKGAVQRIFAVLDAGLPDDSDVTGSLDQVGTLLAEQLVRRSDSLATILRTLQPLLMRSDMLPAAMRGIGRRMPGFGDEFAGILDSFASVIDRIDTYIDGVPVRDAILQGASPVLTAIQTFLDASGSDLRAIGENLLPAASSGAVAIRSIEMGRVLTSLVSTTHGGAVTARPATTPTRDRPAAGTPPTTPTR